MINKADSPELLDTLAVGDRVETWDGIWGTVETVEPETYPAAPHPVVVGYRLTLRCSHVPTVDANGWPASHPGVIIRTVGRHARDLLYAYTPAAARVAS